MAPSCFGGAMTVTALFNRLAVSLAIGLLVGLQRGWQSREAEDHQRAAGFRTFALTGLLGGITGAIARDFGVLVIGFVFLGYSAAFITFQWLDAKANNNLSVTSVVAGMITFLLGSLAVAGNLRVAIAGAVTTSLVLALREPLHRWLASLTWIEIRAVLTLLAMTFLLLPVLPDRTIDPLGVVNPHDVWVMTIAVAAVSFAGYVAVGVFGDRLGILLTAAAGGLASSTATTLVFARLASHHPASARLLGAGILASGTIMMLRVIAIATTLNPALWHGLWPPIAAAGCASGLGAVFLTWGQDRQSAPQLRIENPLAIGTALKLAALIVIVMLFAEAGRRAFGNLGTIVVAGLSGLADVDAVTISMARMDASASPSEAAVNAILLAVLANTMAKTAMAAWVGGPAIGYRTGVVNVLAIACGIAAFWFA
jgi:uncharacterized membrane protein (DUF4010 family)